MPVTLAVPNRDHPSSDRFNVVAHSLSPDRIRQLVDGHDVVVVQGSSLALFPAIDGRGKCLVVDLYDPFTLENFHIHASRPMEERVRIHRNDLNTIMHQILAGDFFMCGHDRQRDFWMGVLAAANRVNPQNSDFDRTFDRILAAVPSGLSDEPPRRSGTALKGVHPAVGKTDRVVLWMGGMWDWLDPLTLIRAVGHLRKEHPNLRLVLPAAPSPDPVVPRMRMLDDARALARKLGLEGTHVIFIGWIPFDARQNYLLEADLGVCMQRRHLETRYAMRTRLLDFIWARLPMVLSEGDFLSEACASAGVARLVPPGDDLAAAQAIGEQLGRPSLRADLHESFDPLLARFSWQNVAKPLLDYCQTPTRAPDHLAPYDEIVRGAVYLGDMAPAWQLPMRALQHIRSRGFAGLGHEVRIALRRRGLIP